MRSWPRRPYAAVFCTAAFFSLVVAANALWIPLKAELAQWLMHRSWQQIQQGYSQARPWPWADTRPAAVLRIPRFGIEQFVLEGNSGRNLAFGPVLVDTTRDSLDQVISGHRDTHFAFMEKLQIGDQIEIQTPRGEKVYLVENMDIIDSRDQEMVLEPSVSRLSLVTCFPFRTAAAGGALRYVITALPASASDFSPSRPVVSSG